MAVRGAVSKEQFFKTLKESFPNGFFYNGGKEFRIPFEEDGAEVQLKITATCAKDNVERPDDEPVETATPTKKVIIPPSADAKNIEPTSEEKENVTKLLQALKELS